MFRDQGYSFGSMMAGQAISPSPTQTGSQVHLRYILISPPISSLVGFLLTPFRSGNLATSLKRIAARKDAEGTNRVAASWKSSKVLIVYGGRDDFTNEATYRRWIDEVCQVADSADRDAIVVKEIRDADHFWSNPRCKADILGAVSEWL